ncbi:MAG: pilus assembly protein PilP [Thermodesulfovibrionales bacterium]
MNIRSCVICLCAIGGLMAGSFASTIDVAQAQLTSEQSGSDKMVQGVKIDKSVLKIERERYTAKGRRDPFISIIALAEEKMTVRKKSTNPIENFDITDFKLLGVIYDGKDYFASVVLPDQKAYTLKKGMKVGLYGGKVDDITSNKLVVKEFVVDFMGQRKSKYTEIKLREEEVR